MWKSVKGAAYSLYARRLRAQLDGASLPRHVAIVMDGNRRWARQAGFADTRVGHRYGAEHLDEVLQWCADIGIKHVTAFVASVDNLRKRDSGEVDNLMRMIEEVVAERLTRSSSVWQVHTAGRLDVLPDSTRHALKLAEEATRHHEAGFHLNVAIGYDGREEILNAIRCLLEEEGRAGHSIDDIAQRLSADQIATHLYTSGQPDPDLVIRTSGERRMSGFLLWQAAYSELHFTDVYWPGFRKVDFLRALRSYAARHRRFGA
ncbi:di-trans,poly-cis-decaprenylcistransferase [Actinoplanes sp. LDG1-06]|uniref:Isoprenyl transferase n=1 Tax=Paractinoplanes ovalisporus TaxID=2810368 RepID=A0ABS2ALF3_9ACTN|nr:polyprenyl diphosphate synthase [Actinoplanes ovalisporus]MBM2620626.1 di-trans,poly-cis-decaprenylcistransferase [Actinoplanes ovalisporus]